MNLRMNKRCWTLPLRQRSVPSAASMTDMTEEAHSCTWLRRSWDDLAPCQCLSKRLSQTCIAVILVWCDKHVPGIRDISKTGHFHPCIGSGTNWLRVNCWCCTLQYFIWPAQEWNKMDQSRFHCSWLALLALSKGCVPSCFHHMCHGLTFSVSPIGAAVCSCQQAAFEVHLLSVGTKTASNQWRFRFQAILFDHTDRLRSFQDHTDLPMHMLMQNWQKIVFHSCKLAYLVRTFASFFDGATAMSILGWWRPVHPSQLRHETVVHTESSWDVQKENQVWSGSCLKLETETQAELKIKTVFLGA